MRRVLIAALASLRDRGSGRARGGGRPGDSSGARRSRRWSSSSVRRAPRRTGIGPRRASAAALARKYTPDVTEIYSPNATWPAVREALQGASLVIYMGHGNGWPSKYRDSLYPPSQNGFGLNPTAPGNDYSHQYFGEGPIADDVRLAKNAVVLLNHLCYASGNTRTRSRRGHARRRPASASTTTPPASSRPAPRRSIAEAYDSPNNMVRVVLGGKRSIEAAWRGAPSRQRQPRSPSRASRSPGYVAQMDPERSSSGFSRSIVLKKRPGVRGRPAQRPRQRARRGRRGRSTPRRSSRAWPARASSSPPRSSRARPRPRASSASRSRSTIADRDKLPDVAPGQRPLGPDRAGRRRSGRRGRPPEPTTGAAVPQIVAPDFGLDQRRAPR